MKIRNKLLLAITVPVGLLIVQIALVNVFVRELQQAATFIAATHKTIEESFSAVDLVANLRQEARRLPSSFVSDRAVGDEGLAAFREEFGKLDERIQSIHLSQASRTTMSEELSELDVAFDTLRSSLIEAEEVLEAEAVDMDGLLSHALFLDRSLVELTTELNELSRNLRVQLQSAVDHEREVHNRPVIAGIAIGGLSVLMLLIFTWLVVDRYFIARVTSLSKALLSIANGDLRATLPEPTGNDEVDEMARTVHTFRHTALERDQLLAEASQAAERLEREVAERTSELKNANQYKTRFLAIASHDLRQPLHALNLFIDQIRNNPKPKRRQQLEGRISEAVSSISELLDALLDMSKLEAGVMTPNVTSFPINVVFERIESTFSTIATNKGLRFRIVRSDKWVSSDAIMLERILLNLVSNAVRATLDGGGILLGCRLRGDALRIDVCDTGPGIPKELHNDLFKEFFHVNLSPENNSDGLGLGLSIVDGLARVLGHQIELSSTPGRGTRFSVRAPIVAAQHPLDVEPVQPKTLEPMTGCRILVIEDDPMVSESMSGILTGWGCEVNLADSVESAVDAAKQNVPDLIISDYRLGEGQTGLDAIAGVHKAAGRVVPALLITAETSVDRLRDAAKSGHPILHKPVTPMALRAVSSHLLADA